MLDYNKIQPILEVYPCIQTEGSFAGRPHILIRTTGCTHRCYFGQGGWCDSWYTSVHPEKGKFSLNRVIELIQDHSHIKNMMITGGSPTMHPDLLDELLSIANTYSMKVTMETEGSRFFPTRHRIDLISLSPKFSNSIPELGVKTPLGNRVGQKLVDQHNKNRLNIDAISKMIHFHRDYHFKPVWDGKDLNVLVEIEDFIRELEIPRWKVWIMPAGSTLEELQPNYASVMEYCIKKGYSFSGRAHIVAYNDQRGV